MYPTNYKTGATIMCKKVFISYAWEDSNFSEKVLAFSNKLRKNGIDAIIDQYEESPDMGWPIWMENQIESSDYVLVVSTKTYFEKFKQMQNGKGVTWEISSIYQSLYNMQGHNDKFIPVVFCEDDKQYVLKALQPYTIYNLETQFEKLRNRILEIPNVIKPPVVKPLPERNRKCMFVSSPINIELWDKARWRGTAFLYYPNGGWFLGLLYSGNKNAAIEIFDEWKEYDDIDKHLEIVFIEGNINKLPPNGYTCLIQPNMSESINRIKSVNGDDETIVLTVSRFQRMYPKDNFLLYNKFKEIYYKNKGKPIPIVPVTIIDKKKDITLDNIEVNIKSILYTRNIRYMKAKDIKRTDIESCVIPDFNQEFPLET